MLEPRTWIVVVGIGDVGLAGDGLLWVPTG
jgi:hypothetical protein